ncbi:MAG: DUF6785 family protein [Candidatus Hodarchaeales archaeon]|jgi:hypothetical protein
MNKEDTFSTEDPVKKAVDKELSDLVGRDVKSGFTRRSFIIGFSVLMIWGIMSIFAGNFAGTAGETADIFIESMSVLFPFFLLIFGLQILDKIRIRGVKLTAQELTFIWAMLIIGIPITNSGFIAGRLLLNAMFTHQGEPMSPPTGWGPTFWAPSREEILNAYPGGLFPNIGEWLVPIIFWGITAFAWAFMCIFLIQLFRKPWVDVERLAFPLAQPVQELLEAPLAPPMEKKRRRYWLAIGAILAMSYASLEFLREVYQIELFPDFIFGIVPGNAWNVKIDLGKEFGLSAILPNAYLEARPEPIMIAVFMLVSLNVLLSGIVFYLLFWVLIPVLQTELGIIEPPTVVASPPDIDLGFGRLGGISLFAFGEFGMLFGVALWVIILQRKYLWRTIKAIWDPSVIDETGEPISYRTAWIGLIICSVIFLLALILSGSPLIGAIYAVIFLMVGYVAGARLRAETAGMGVGHPGYLHLHGMHTARLVIGGNTTPETGTQGFYITSMWLQFFQRDAAMSTPAISSLEAYNIARVTKTRTRDIFLSGAIGVSATIILCLVIWPIFAYSYGLGNEWSGEAGHNFDYSESSIELTRGGFWDHRTYDIDTWGQAIMGAVFAIGLNILRLSRPWLPLNPIAGPILLSLRGGYWWLPIVIAYIVKYLVVRIGGTRAYTQYLLPAAVGYLIGTAGIWGYTLLALMIPSVFAFIFQGILLDLFTILVFVIWAAMMIAVIVYIIIGTIKK